LCEQEKTAAKTSQLTKKIEALYRNIMMHKKLTPSSCMQNLIA